MQQTRSDRLREIPWWPADTIRAATFLLVGDGGVGNKVAEHLACLGVRRVVLVDPDTVEPSNLSRAAHFFPSDVGQSKVEVTASRLAEQSPETEWVPISARIEELGWGVFREADVVLIAPDNHFARYYSDMLAGSLRKHRVHGGLGAENVLQLCVHALSGREDVCYMCGLSAQDVARKLEAGTIRRFATCGSAAEAAAAPAHVASLPTSAGVTAALMVSEAVRLLGGSGEAGIASRRIDVDLGAPSMRGRPIRPLAPCPFHRAPVDPIAPCGLRSDRSTVSELVRFIEQSFGSGVVLALPCDRWDLSCTQCSWRRIVHEFVSLESLSCPVHGTSVVKTPLGGRFVPGQEQLDASLAAVGVRAFEILTVLDPEGAVVGRIEIDGDSASFAAAPVSV